MAPAEEIVKGRVRVDVLWYVSGDVVPGGTGTDIGDPPLDL